MNLCGAALEKNQICELIFQYSFFMKIPLFTEATLEQQQRVWFPKWHCLGVSFPRQWMHELPIERWESWKVSFITAVICTLLSLSPRYRL